MRDHVYWGVAVLIKQLAKRAALLVPALAAGAITDSATSAHAHPKGQIVSSCPSNVTYKYVGSIDSWLYKTSASAGFTKWNSVLGRTGLPVVLATPGTLGTNIKVEFSNTLPANVRATASCSGRYIRFNEDYIHGWNTLVVAATAAHEMGHIFGLGHTGIQDNLADQTTHSIMATCNVPNNSDLTADDNAALMSTRVDNSLANPSFENYDASWKTNGSPTSRVYSSSANAGSYVQEYTPNDQESYFYQEQSNYYQPRPMQGFEAWVRKTSPAASGDIYVQLWSRKYDYQFSGSPQCEWPSSTVPLDVNANVRINVQSRYYLESYDSNAATTSWRKVQTSAVLPRGSSAESFDAQVRVVSDVKFSDGTYDTIHIDDTVFVS